MTEQTKRFVRFFLAMIGSFVSTQLLIHGSTPWQIVGGLLFLGIFSVLTILTIWIVVSHKRLKAAETEIAKRAMNRLAESEKRKKEIYD